MSLAYESFEQIVVSIVERNVDIASVRDAAHRMFEDEAAVGADFSAVRSLGKGFYHLVGRFDVKILAGVPPEFVKC